MNKKRLIITSIISIVLVSILLIGSTYSIFVTTEVDESSNVYKTGNLDITYTLSSSNVTINDITPMTESEADSVYPYRITVTNNGNVPYMFDVILNDTTSTEAIDYKYIMTKVGYLEPKSLNDCTNNIIKEDVILPAGQSVDIDVRVWLDSTIPNSEIGKSFYSKLSIDGIAIYDDNKEINNDVLSLKYMKELFPYTEDVFWDGTYEIKYFKSNTYEEYIKNASFVNYIDTSNAVEYWDVSEKGDNSVVAWVENNEETGYYDLYIGAKYKIYAKSLKFFFYGHSTLNNINFDNLDTSLTENMAYMFGECSSLTSLDVSSFDTSNVTNMAGMFIDCLRLIELDLSNFDTSKVTDMNSMFALCMELIELDVSSFDTSNVINMVDMFHNCDYLTELDLSNFDTSKVTDMSYMFMYCVNLTTTITIRNSTTTYDAMFSEAATETNAQITVNYTSATSELVDSMIATKSTNSNVVKGSQIS